MRGCIQISCQSSKRLLLNSNKIMPLTSNSKMKTITQYSGLSLLVVLVLYGIFVLSGFFMVIFLYAVSPWAQAFETVILDYTVWALWGLLILIPWLILLRRHYPVAIPLLRRLCILLLYFLVASSALCLIIFFLVNSLVVNQIFVVGNIIFYLWYVNRVKYLIWK